MGNGENEDEKEKLVGCFGGSKKEEESSIGR